MPVLNESAEIQTARTVSALTGPEAGEFDVHAFGCRFRLAASNPDAVEVLQRFVFPTLPRISPGVAEPDHRICLEANKGKYRLFADDAFVASAPEAKDLVVELIRVLDETIVEHLNALHAVHAGAVLWRGRVLLLPGKSHAGKSSLVAELLRQGATYFTDEYALIDRDGWVHPYPRPLLLRNGSPRQMPALAEECNARVGDTAAPVGMILFVVYSPDRAWSIEPTSQGIAFLNLLKNTPHVLTASPEMVASFQRAVADARCFAGTRGDAVEASRRILRMIDENAAA